MRGVPYERLKPMEKNKHFHEENSDFVKAFSKTDFLRFTVLYPPNPPSKVGLFVVF